MRLSFEALDDLAFACSKYTNESSVCEIGSYLPVSLGPLMEFLFLTSAGVIPQVGLEWLNNDHLANFLEAWSTGRPTWLSSSRHFGFFRTVPTTSSEFQVESTDFLIKMQRAARDLSKLPGTLPGQMVAAIRELSSNIEEHSGSIDTGVIAFRAKADTFEFVVADHGRGILDSLRGSPEFMLLADHGRALELALTDGVSRFHDPTRGHGFRPIFQGLADLNGYLRFRSGDHAVIMDGTSPKLATAQIVQKPTLSGFFVSVRCEIRRQGL